MTRPAGPARLLAALACAASAALAPVRPGALGGEESPPQAAAAAEPMAPAPAPAPQPAAAAEPPAVTTPAEARAEPPPPPAQLEAVRALQKLRGKDYIEARRALLGTATGEQLRATRGAAGADAALGRLCDALLWRQAEARTAELLDKHGAAPLVSGSAGAAEPAGDALWGSHNATRAMISCFGQEALPALAERLLYEGHPAGCRIQLVDLLAELRDLRAPGVLLELASRPEEEPRLRAAAVWRLEKCLSGVPAMTMPHAAGKDPSGLGPRVVPELADLAKPMKLASMEVRGDERAMLEAGLAGLLTADKDPRIRSLAARALRHGGAAAVPALSGAASSDQSPWVRAWCADTLRRLGLPEARKALAAARAAEQNADVLAVMDGHAEPVLPEQGVPGKSILRGR
ncbi:MAG TPA: HEAT repeat domain-containing protein [Planctomycetota bacterium]|nr:HEAT repeat domain-containing protein [Planctomycetota bacterium]